MKILQMFKDSSFWHNELWSLVVHNFVTCLLAPKQHESGIFELKKETHRNSVVNSEW